MHLLGKAARAYAVTPSADTIQLIKIRSWDFHWQGGYAFTRPVKIPRGSTIYYSASYDNTTNNPENPNTPPQVVRWGEATTDEMFLCYFHWLPYQAGDESIDMNTPLPTSVIDFHEHIASSTFTVHPSPARDYIAYTLIAERAGDITLEIIDAQGIVVDISKVSHHIDAGVTADRINTKHLPAGAYVLRARGNIDASTSFIIQR